MPPSTNNRIQAIVDHSDKIFIAMIAISDQRHEEKNQLREKHK